MEAILGLIDGTTTPQKTRIDGPADRPPVGPSARREKRHEGGFSQRWTDLPDYILGITRDIWEGRDIAGLQAWYAPDIPVRTPMGGFPSATPVSSPRPWRRCTSSPTASGWARM